MRYAKRFFVFFMIGIGLINTNPLNLQEEKCSVVKAASSSATTLVKGKTKKVYITKGKHVSFKVQTGGKTRKVKWTITSGSSKGKIIKSNNKLATSYKTKTVKVKGLKKGTANIKATYKGSTYKAKVVVETPTLDKTSVVIKKGESATVKMNGTKREVVFGTTTSNGVSIAKASVSASTPKQCTVQGVQAGVCKLLGVVGSTTKECSVRVLDINKASLDVMVGDEETLSVLGKAKDKSVDWSSTDKSVATVNSNGVVVAKGKGSCKIKGKVHGKTVSCEVVVSEKPVVSYKAKYSYEVKLLNRFPVYTTYNEKKLNSTEEQACDLSFAYVYIKTENPNPATIYLENPRGVGAEKVFKDVSIVLGNSDEIYYGTDLNRVNGGYVGVISLKEKGLSMVEVREVSGARNDTSYEPRLDNKWKSNAYSQQVATLSIPNVKSYTETEKAWYKSVIAEQTTSSMTDKQKMDAITNYLSKAFVYFPYSASPHEIIHLVSHQGAYWDTKEVDCVRYCYIVRNFASMLGLSSDSTYAGYDNHYYATVTFKDGSKKSYDNGPNSYSNILNDGSWEMLDK